MSVTSVTLSWRGKTQNRRNGETTRIDIYTVLATAPTPPGDVRNEIEADPGIPAYGSTPDDRDDIFVRDIAIREGGGPNVWEVIVAYSSVPNADSSPDQDPDHPEYDPPTADFIEIEESEIWEVDEDGTKIQNSALEPFDPPLQRTRRKKDVEFTRNFTECTVTPAWLARYTDVVNNAAIAAFNSVEFPGQGARGTVRIVGSPRPERVRPNGELVGHWRVSFTLRFRENPTGSSESDPDVPPYAAHFRRVVDQGFHELVGHVDDLPVYDDIRTQQGSQLNQPAQLDGAGRQLTEGEAPVYLYFREFPERDLSSLVLLWPYCDGIVSDSGSGSET